MKTRENYLKKELPIKKELKSYLSKNEEIVIFDIGACEALDSIKYSKLYPKAKIYAFEPLPDNIEICKKNIKEFSASNVHLVPLALSDEEGQSHFYISSGTPNHVNEKNSWNYGNKSSSLLKPDKVTEVHDWLKFENKILINTTTIKNFCISENITSIDFIHMDVQGAELKVLRGAKEFLDKVGLIWTEISKVALYEDQPLMDELNEFTLNNNFRKIKEIIEGHFGDILYINNNLNEKSIFKKIFRIRS